MCVCVFIMEKGRKNAKIEKNEKKKEQCVCVCVCVCGSCVSVRACRR